MRAISKPAPSPEQIELWKFGSNAIFDTLPFGDPICVLSRVCHGWCGHPDSITEVSFECVDPWQCSDFVSLDQRNLAGLYHCGLVTNK